MSADVETDLAGAQAKFVVFLAALLKRTGVVDADEFAGLLSAFATTVIETDPREGEILDRWASAVRSSLPERTSSTPAKDALRRLLWPRHGKR
jgi:hypothetical protein